MAHIDFGLTVFSTQAFAGFAPDQPFDLGEVVKHLIAHGQLACHEVHVRFHEVGTPEGLKELEAHLLSRPKQT
jgi:NDP-sugar pyrophosphorylase family protein